MIKIVADRHIPHIMEYFSPHAEIRQIDAADMSPDTLHDADVLLVRTVTNVNKSLLEKTHIKFVGSASAGKNHIDEAYLKNRGITFHYAPGCNALAVTEYVMACFAALGKTIQSKKIGVIGLGHVGKKVVDVLERAGAIVIKNDPPLGFEADFRDCDAITLHCSLTAEGKYPSYHLINSTVMRALKPGTVIINAARGGVLDESALRDDLVYCLDVWENEPHINIHTFNRAMIKTPHIAGYSVEAKHRATKMLYEAFCQWANCPTHYPTLSAPVNPVKIKLDSAWPSALLKHYSPFNDHFEPTLFNHSRQHYPLRKEVVL